jgi:hypothetical protein
VVELNALKLNRNRMRRGAASVILLALLPGCSGIPPSRIAGDEAPISSYLQIPALTALPDRGPLTIKQLEEGLRPFVNEGQGRHCAGTPASSV